MDSLSTGSASGHFLIGSLGIILINIVLSGDNSVVIAMAAHALPKSQRLKAICIGTLGAVVLRVLFTWFASHLLETQFLKLVGGALILWIAVKLLLEDVEADAERKSPASLRHAVWMILAADLTMSLDNVLAVAGASHGNMMQLWLSLGTSIPLVVFASAVLSRLMDRFPIIIWLGAALLAKVGGEMIYTDPGLYHWFKLESVPLRIAFESLCVAGALGLALWIKRRSPAEAEASAPGSDPAGEDAEP